MNIGLLIAGGVGIRTHMDVPKQFLTVNEKPVIVYTMEAFQNHEDIDEIAVVCLDGWDHILAAYGKQYGITKLQHIITGGDCGQASIRNGIYELEKHYSSDDIVLIHDGIRPMVSHEIISDCIKVTRQCGNATAVIPCMEAMIETEDAIVSNGIYAREKLKRSQTPQGFFLGEISELHREAIKAGITNSVASCTLMIEMGKKIYFSEGSEKNIKLTTMEDFEIFRALLGFQNGADRS